MAEKLTWHGNKLYLGKRLAGEIVQDKTYPTMWRVLHPDGSLSDMVNLTRAKDACAAMTATSERKGRQRRLEVPQARFFSPTLPIQPPIGITASSRPSYYQAGRNGKYSPIAL